MSDLLPDLQLGLLGRFLTMLEGDGPLIVLEKSDQVQHLIRSVRLILMGEQPIFSQYKQNTEIIEVHPYSGSFDEFLNHYNLVCEAKEMVFLFIGGGGLSHDLRFFIQQFKHELSADRQKRSALTFFVTSASNIKTSDRDLPALFGVGRVIFLHSKL